MCVVVVVGGGSCTGCKLQEGRRQVLTRAVPDVDGETRDVRGVGEAAVTEVLREEHGLPSQGQGVVWTLTPRGRREGGEGGSRRLP